MEVSFITYLGCLLGSVLLTYFTGHLLLSPVCSFRENGYRSIFFKMTTGLLFSTILFAAIITGFKTVYLSVFLLGLLGFCYLISKNKISFNIQTINSHLKQIEWIPMLYVSIIGLIIFFFQFNLIFDFSGNAYSIHFDTAYYANVASFMNDFKVESSGDPINLEYLKPGFYHFFELWNALLYANLFQLNILNSLILVSNSLMMLIVVIGTSVFVQRNFKLPDFTTLLISLFILFIGHFWTTFGSDSFYRTPGFVLNNIYIQKLIIVYLAFILYVSLLEYKSLFARIFPFCLMFLLYGPTLPAVVVGIIVYFIYLFLCKNSTISKKKWIYSILAIVISVGFIFLFYKLTDLGLSTPTSNKGGTSKIQNLYSYYQADFIKNLLSSTIFLIQKVAYYIVILFIPFTLLLLLLFKKKINIQPILNNYLLLFLILIIGLIGHAYTHMITDSIQLFTNIAIPAIAFIYFATLLFVIFKFKSPIIKIGSIGLLALCFYGNFSLRAGERLDRDFYRTIEHQLKQDDSPIVYLFDKEICDDGSIVRSAKVIYALWNTVRLTNHFYPICLNSFDISYDENNPTDVSYKKAAIISSPFYRWVKKKKAEGVELDTFGYQIQYLKETKSKYIITNKNSQWIKSSPYKIEKIIESQEEKFWFVVLDLEVLN